MASQSGPIIIDLAGLELSPEDRDILKHPLVGGVILFSRNYHSKEQLAELCKSIRLTKTTPLLIAVDQEGGRVQRFKDDFTKIPPMGVLGQYYDKDPQLAIQAAKALGYVMAEELVSVDIDLSFAPVLDLDKGKNTVIGDRSFHHQPIVVIELAKAFIAGMTEVGMQPTGKHFPGHGDVSLDSHIAMPVDPRGYSEILETDLIPFIELLPYLPALMTAHIIFPAIDNKPVCFSTVWMQKIIRQQLNFDGIMFSDDLSMEGAAVMGDYPDRVDQALQAGCDFVLVCNNRNGLIKAIDKMDNQRFVSEEKINRLRPKRDKSFNPNVMAHKKLVVELQEKL